MTIHASFDFSKCPINSLGEAGCYAKACSMMGSFLHFQLTPQFYKDPQYDPIHNLVINVEVVSQKQCLYVFSTGY